MGVAPTSPPGASLRRQRSRFFRGPWASQPCALQNQAIWRASAPVQGALVPARNKAFTLDISIDSSSVYLNNVIYNLWSFFWSILESWVDFETECRQIINVIGAVLMQILSGSGPRFLKFSHVEKNRAAEFGRDTARVPRLNMVGTKKKDTTSPCQKPQCTVLSCSKPLFTVNIQPMMRGHYRSSVAKESSWDRSRSWHQSPRRGSGEVPAMSPLMSNPWAVDSWCRTILLRAVSVRECVFFLFNLSRLNHECVMFACSSLVGLFKCINVSCDNSCQCKWSVRSINVFSVFYHHICKFKWPSVSVR